MTTSATIGMSLQSIYGAAELKVFIRKNTYKAFVITLAVLVSFLLLYWLTGVLSAEKVKVVYDIPQTEIPLYPPPRDVNAEEDVPPPPPSSDLIQYATEKIAGVPVPLPDAEIADDSKIFAPIEELGQSLSKEKGINVDFANIPKDFVFDNTVNIQQKEVIPDININIAIEKMPDVDLSELQKKVVYPEVARKVGIEGKVIVRVLVGKDGQPQKAVVQYSDSDMLDKASVEAVMKTVFTPGIQNGQPVLCWVNIPIVFKLKN